MKFYAFFLVLLTCLACEAQNTVNVYFGGTNGTNGTNILSGQMLQNATNYGVVPDGMTDNTAAITDAIEITNLFFPPGIYITSHQLPVPSNRRIHLMEGAVFKAAPHSVPTANSAYATNSVFWVNADWTNGNSNIWIEGGTYDGNIQNQGGINWNTPGQFLAGSPLRFLNVTNLVIRDMTLKNNPTVNMQLGNITNLDVERIRIYTSQGWSSNQDGIHLNGAVYNFIISDVWANGVNSDLIALNADDISYGAMSQGDIHCGLVENIYSAGHANPWVGEAVRFLVNTHSVYDVRISGVRGFYGSADGVFSENYFFNAWANGAGVWSVIIENCDVTTSQFNTPFAYFIYAIASDITLRNNVWTCGAQDNIGIGAWGLNEAFLYIGNCTGTNISVQNCRVQNHAGNTYLVDYAPMIEMLNVGYSNINVSGFNLSRWPGSETGGSFIHLGGNSGFSDGGIKLSDLHLNNVSNLFQNDVGVVNFQAGTVLANPPITWENTFQ